MRGNDDYLIEYSYSFSNLTNPGAASPDAAIHQASKDISYSTLQSFCSSYLGYSTAVTTVTTTATFSPFTVVTVYPYPTTTVQPAKRSAGSLSTPDVLTKYPSAILSSACSLQATPVSGTSTLVSTVTTTLVTSTSTVTGPATATVTAGPSSNNACVSVPGGLGSFAIQADYNSQYLVGGQSESSHAQFTSPNAAGAQSFYLDGNCILTEATGNAAAFQANEDSGVTSESVYFNSPGDVIASGYALVTCQVGASYKLTCSVQGNSISGETSDAWTLSSDNSFGVITLKAVPL
jgi:hypothetical protein